MLILSFFEIKPHTLYSYIIKSASKKLNIFEQPGILGILLFKGLDIRYHAVFLLLVEIKLGLQLSVPLGKYIFKFPECSGIRKQFSLMRPHIGKLKSYFRKQIG